MDPGVLLQTSSDACVKHVCNWMTQYNKPGLAANQSSC